MEFIERLKADLITLGGSLRALRYTTHIAKNPTRVFPQLIEELAEKYGDAPALLSDRESFSYRELGARSNRYARWALAQGIAKGDTVCLLMPNRPEFLAIWIGITRVGGVVALLNTNLVGHGARPLHQCGRRPGTSSSTPSCFRRCNRRSRTSRRTPRSGCTATPPPTCRASIARSRACPATPLADNERRALTIEDRALFIYTSGTTGLPKAANINHYRLMLATHAFAARHEHARQRPHVRLPAALPHLRRRAGDRRAAAQGRLGGDPRPLLRARVLGRRGALGVHAAAIYRRVLPLPRQLAAAIRRSASTSCGSPAATGCVPTSGRNSSSASRFRRSSSSTPPPKAT